MTTQSTPLAEDSTAVWFGVDEALIRGVLAEATARGADFADLYFQHGRHSSIRLEDGIVSLGSTGVDQGVGVRVVIDEQTGYAYSESLQAEPMKRAARTAAAIASGGEAVPPQAVRLGEVPDYYPLERAWEEVRVGEKLPLLRRVEELARAAEPSIEKVNVVWADSDQRVLIATSEGLVLCDRRPMGTLRVGLTAQRDGTRCTGHASLARREGLAWFSEERLGELCREAVENTTIQFEARRPPAGELPVVLAAGASGILLHEAIGHGLEADFNRKGTSIYADLLGQRVAPEFVTVVDDGTLDHERGALNVDDEGSPTERTVLIEGGVLRSYLYDRISARQYGVPSSGSGRRQSFRHVPMPRMRCTFMENGPHGYDEMIASIEKGVVCETFRNGQVQIGAGDFTFYVKTGWLIEGGKITAPIKDINIIGNGPQALRDITMAADDCKLDRGGWTCGKEGQSVPVSQGLPSVLVKGLTVEVAMVEALATELLDEAERAVEVGLGAGAQHVVAAINAGRSTELTWRDGRVETVRESAGHSLSVRLHVDGRYSSHGTNDLRPASLAAFVADAVELTRALEPDPHRLPVDPALYEGRSELDLELCDPALTRFDRERALAWLGEMDEEARAHERVVSSTSHIDSSHNRSAMVTSNGFRGAREGTALWCVTEVTARDEGDKRPEASYYRGARHLDDLPEPRGVAVEARRRALERLGSVKAPSKRATMVVEREAAPRLISRVLGALSASAIQQKRSFLADRLGQPIAAPCLSLSDEPLLKRGFSSRHFDGEGIAARPRAILREGVLETYFVDTYYGRKLGWEPTTGSSSNVVFEPGTRSLEELVAATDDGVLVTSWLGGNADPTTGDFSFGIGGHLIEAGRRTVPVTEMNITGNYLELLGSLAEVGDDPHPYASVRCPSLVFEGVGFSGS